MNAAATDYDGREYVPHVLSSVIAACCLVTPPAPPVKSSFPSPPNATLSSRPMRGKVLNPEIPYSRGRSAVAPSFGGLFLARFLPLPFPAHLDRISALFKL